MSIHVVKFVDPNKCHKFVTTIYKNFIDLANYPELKHNIRELTRLVTSKDAKVYLIVVNNKIAAYLVGEIMKLNDGRRVFYISYLYTSKLFRKKGFGTKLMNRVEAYSKDFSLDGILLTYDTEDTQVNNFYLMKGFMPDMLLRKYDKFDVLFKKL